MHRCENCHNFEPDASPDALHECRKKPPVVSENQTMGAFPCVEFDWWCGEFEPNIDTRLERLKQMMSVPFPIEKEVMPDA
jgi:hypothetical protein